MDLLTVIDIAAVPLSLFLIATILLETFESLVLPRRIERPHRLTPFFFRALWRAWRRVASYLPVARRDDFLAIFGPLSLLVVIIFWASGLILGFALLQWGMREPISAPEGAPGFGTYLYLSATSFVTLGLGDVTPRSGLERLITDLEAGTGFGFLALVIAYLPVLYGAFSRREVDIALLDARASSPPSAGALLQRIGGCKDLGDLYEVLRQYERWSAELLESHLSYPTLMYYRSQHDRQSWLAALTTILDTCAFLIAASSESKVTYQARMTFAMSRHAAIDLALAFDTPPTPPQPDRLPSDDLAYLRSLLTGAGMTLKTGVETDARLADLRRLYEPFVNALSHSLLLSLPSWLPNPDLPDNWQTSAWDRSDHFFQTGDAAEAAESNRP
jgi:hypothetical protein